LKITTWNVNGIRAVLGKGLWDRVRELDPDIFCLQEIKAKEDQVAEDLRNLPGYEHHWNPAERPGYSGVATYYRQLPVQISLGLGDERFDDEGRVIRLDYSQFTLFNIYFPNGQRGLDRVEYKLEFYAKLLDICNDLHKAGKQIIITGDFNTAHQEIDLANPKENSKTSGFLPEEREWVQRFLDSGFLDAFRVLYPDRIQYTWWTYRFGARRRNIGWRLDYYLVSNALMERVQDVVIHDQIEGSDHCPVTLTLDI